MRIRCNDGMVRRFQISVYTGSVIEDTESKCLECGKVFGETKTFR